MDTTSVSFNRNPLITGKTIEAPDESLVKQTLGLWNVSVEDALKYGGELTRAAIGAMNLRNDRKYIVVDSKVHMLMEGFYPAIPGWHTDGVPRGVERDPGGKGLPNIFAQDEPGDLRPPRYHLLVTGSGCLTEFITTREVDLEIPDFPTINLYRLIHQQLEAMLEQRVKETYKREDFVSQYSNQVVEFDWWDLHRGIAATKKEWRFLIRVAETDYIQPQTDLRTAIRTQSNVYVEAGNYGW